MRSLSAGMLVLGFIVAGVPGMSRAAAQDPRLDDMARWLDAGDLETFNQQIYSSDWTQSVLQGLSKNQRRSLADSLRKRKTPVIREARMEQYRFPWRSRDEADSDAVVSFYLNERPGDRLRPLLAFSSRPEYIPELLAEALKKNQMPLFRSFHEPLSTWLESSPAWSPNERKNRVTFYRALKVIEKKEDEWVFKGPYISAQGLLVQDELRLRLAQDGRWQVE